MSTCKSHIHQHMEGHRIELGGQIKHGRRLCVSDVSASLTSITRPTITRITCAFITSITHQTIIGITCGFTRGDIYFACYTFHEAKVGGKHLGNTPIYLSNASRGDT